MANAAQGRGKSAFRAFKRDLLAIKRDIIASFVSGFPLSPTDIQNHYDLVFSNYVRSIEDADLPNPQIWVNRGDLATAKSENETLEKLGLEPANELIDPSGEEITFTRVDKETDEEKELSVPIINPSDRLGKAGIVVRKRLVTPDEIESYVAEVPYLIGVQPVFEDGRLKGYRVWVQK